MSIRGTKQKKKLGTINLEFWNVLGTVFLTQVPIHNSLGQLDYLVTFKGPIINGAPFNIYFFGSHLGKQSYDKSVNKLPNQRNM